MRLLHYFWNNVRWISIINGFFNVINGNKNIKSCEFCVKILHRECREVAKKLWFWLNIAYQLDETYLLIKNFDITKAFSARQLLKLSFMSPKDRAKFVYLYSSFVYSMADEAVYWTESAMFLSSEKQRSFGSFVNKG